MKLGPYQNHGFCGGSRSILLSIGYFEHSEDVKPFGSGVMLK